MTKQERGRNRTRAPKKAAQPAKRRAGAERVTRITADRIRALREARGFTAATLAERCAELGAPAMSAHVIASIQTHRRGISIEELLVLALALDVPPAQLLTPATTPEDADATALAVTSTVQITDPEQARRWIVGEQPLPETQDHHYYAWALDQAGPGQVTDQALSAQARAVLREGAQRLAGQYEAQIEQFTQTMRAQVSDLLDELDQAVTGTPDQIATTIHGMRTRLTPPSA